MMSNKQEAKLYIRKAAERLEQGKTKQAINQYIKAIYTDCSLAAPYKAINQKMGKLNEQQKNELIEFFTQLTATNNNLPFEFYTFAGNLFEKVGKLDQALPFYQYATLIKASEVNSSFPSPGGFQNMKDDLSLGKPNFLIIGAAKAGTTALYSYLVQHPKVLPSLVKEIGFFNREDRRKKGTDFYSANFPFISESEQFLTGEATPAYIVSDVQDLVFNYYPDVKLIVILRDPVKRAISHYYHRKNNHPQLEPRSLEAALEEELRTVENVGNCSEIDDFCRDNKLVYLLGGLYYYTINKWMSVFPPEQFLILENTQLLTQPNDTMQKVYSFLGLPEYNISEYKKRNVGSYQKEDMSLIENKLYQFFQSHNEKLESFLNINCHWNKS